MGRIIESKGVQIIKELALHFTDRKFKIAGPGDFDNFFANISNVFYHGLLFGKERSDFLQGAAAMLLPTSYFEPFGGALVSFSSIINHEN